MPAPLPQAEIIWSVMSTGHAMWGELLDAAQVAAAVVSAYPLAPTPLAMRAALHAYGAREGAGAAAGGSSHGAAAPHGGGGGSGGGSGGAEAVAALAVLCARVFTARG